MRLVYIILLERDRVRIQILNLKIKKREIVKNENCINITFIVQVSIE